MSSEVGTGHVTVMPVMRGFKATVTRETKSAGAAGAKSFEGGFGGAGRAAGRALGRDLKRTFESSAGDLGAAQTKKLTSEIASASAGLARVRLKQQDEAGKVRVAETRLAEAIAKSGAQSSRAVAAEERLASARRSHASVTDQVVAASNRLKTAQTTLKAATDTAGKSSTRGLTALRNGMSGLATSAANTFQTVVGAARNAGATAGRVLGQGIQAAATTAMTVAAAGVGIAVTKGFARLGAIDTARAKLTGLGNDAGAVDSIMNDALASVRGTAFGLGEAATVAAGAVAAGIKPGEQLQGTLKGVANVAAAAGTSMEETGSIFNKVAATGIAYTENINQLADRGIPIWQSLATQFGVTTAEVREMASSGEIDFQTFSDAAAAAAGTVAQEMGKTVPGAAKNFFAAMGRIGANALGPIYGRIAPLITAATSALGPIEERAKAFGDILLRVVGPAMDWITGLLTKIGEGASLASLGLGGLESIIGPIAGAFAALGAGGLAGVLTKLPLVGGMLGGIAGPLAALGGPLGIAAAAFAGFALSGADMAQVAQVVPEIVSSILAQIPSLLATGASMVRSIIDGLVSALPSLVAGAISLVAGLVDAIVSNLPFIIRGAIQLVRALIDGIVTAVPLLVTAAIRLVEGLLLAIVGALPMIIEGGIRLLMALIEGIVGAIPMLIEAGISLVMGLLDAIIRFLPDIIQAGITLLLSLVTGLIEALPQLITAAISLVLQLIAGLLTMLPELVQAGITLIVSLISGLIEAIPQILESIPQIIDAIVTGFMEVDWLSLGADIIQGIIDGFFSMVGSVGDAIGDVVGGILDFFPNSPAKKGPLSAPGWRKLKQSGAATMEQFNAGAEDEAPRFGDAITAAAQAASAQAQLAVGAAHATVTAGTPDASQAATSGTPMIHQENYFDHLPVEVGIEATGQQLASIAKRNGG